jgi:hypothetical protein
MSSSVASREGLILSRVLRREHGEISGEMARWLLGIDFDPADHERMALLSAKAREGTLTEEEDAELEDYGDVGRLLEMLKAKAKIALKKPGLA